MGKARCKKSIALFLLKYAQTKKYKLWNFQKVNYKNTLQNYLNKIFPEILHVILWMIEAIRAAFSGDSVN